MDQAVRVHAVEPCEQAEREPGQAARIVGPPGVRRAFEKLHREERGAAREGAAFRTAEVIGLDEVRMPELGELEELAPRRTTTRPRPRPHGRRLQRDDLLRDEIERPVDEARRAASRDTGEEPPSVDRFA